MIFGGAPLDEEKKQKLDEAFNILEQFLEKSKWVAGDDITLADISVAVTVSTAEVSRNSFFSSSKCSITSLN